MSEKEEYWTGIDGLVIFIIIFALIVTIIALVNLQNAILIFWIFLIFILSTLWDYILFRIWYSLRQKNRKEVKKYG